jgi:hypothetical protein
MTTRLPLPSILYLTIAGLTAAAGWQFYLAFEEQRSRPSNADFHAELLKDFQLRMETGRSRQPDQKLWNPEPHKTSFRDANLTGKLPPPPPTETETAEEKEPEVKPKIPLSDIFVLRALCHESTSIAQDAAASDEEGAAGESNQTSVVIEYKPEANIEPPEDVAVAVPYSPADTGRATNRNGRGRTTNRPATRGRGVAAPPTFAAGKALTHTVFLDEPLWPPFEHIRLVRVDEKGDFAVFQREEPGQPEEEWVEEKVFKSVLELGQELLSELARLGAASGERGGEREPGAEPDAPVDVQPGRDNGWIASPTTIRRGNQVHVGEDLAERVRTEPDRVFNELGVRSYTSRSGSVSGLQVTRVPAALQNFGVQQGDVILSVNGESVRDKAQAYSIGKRQYQRGERSFQVEMISNGQRVTRTILAPNR